MKILFTSIVDLKKSQHNRPHQFVKYLSKNHEITVISINDWWKGKQGDLASYSSDFSETFEKIDYHYLTEKHISPILQEVLFTKKIRELSDENFDVHLNYNSLISGYRASKHFKTVFDLADDLPEMIAISPQIPNFLKPFGKMLGNYYLKKSLKNADYVTLTDESLRKAYNISNSRANIVPNGVNIKDFMNDINAKEELGLNGFIVGYVGVLRGWVDFEPVFKALKYLNNEIKVLIIGSEGNFNENRELAHKLGVEDRVIFTGMIPYSQIPKYISAMDIGIIPFKKGEVASNALPLKLFEYFACKKPVISSELFPIKSNFSDVVLFASNYKDYINNIELLYEDKQLRKNIGEMGRKISENYDWKHITSNLEKILNNVAYGE
jgi:glycosyltransferase involved in cell wall biosynthesis